MSDFKHTRGPWEIVYRDDDRCMSMTVIAQKGSMGSVNNVMRLSEDENRSNVIAITWHQLTPLAGENAFNNDQHDANSRLIAAAPCLLEALVCIVNSLSEYDEEGLIEHTEQMQKAREAINKATGS